MYTWANWYCTTGLLVCYVLVFQFWRNGTREAVLLSLAPAVAAIGFLLFYALKRGYFANRWDAAFHASVLIDIILEGLLIQPGRDLGFYWCAIAFAVFITGYRILRLKAARPISKQP